MPKSADSTYESEMTETCEKWFKKLTRREQEAINKRILELETDPTCGDPFEGPELKGILHSHVLGRSSNCVIAWSTYENPHKRVLIESVGGHNNIERLKRLKREFRY